MATAISRIVRRIKTVKVNREAEIDKGKMADTAEEIR